MIPIMNEYDVVCCASISILCQELLLYYYKVELHAHRTYYIQIQKEGKISSLYVIPIRLRRILILEITHFNMLNICLCSHAITASASGSGRPSVRVRGLQINNINIEMGMDGISFQYERIIPVVCWSLYWLGSFRIISTYYDIYILFYFSYCSMILFMKDLQYLTYVPVWQEDLFSPSKKQEN